MPNKRKELLRLGKPYNPRGATMQDNRQSWEAVQAYLRKRKGHATLEELQEHLKKERNHANFAKYCIRKGWLVVKH